MEIKIEDYLSEEEIKEIVKEEVKKHVRNCVGEVSVSQDKARVPETCKEGDWVYGYLVKAQRKYTYYILGDIVESELDSISPEFWVEVDMVTIGANTGLKDKYENDIYVGDILSGKFNVDEVEDYIYLTLTEEEKETGVKLFHITDIFYGYTHPLPDNIEVIGNIHDNANLLK